MLEREQEPAITITPPIMGTEEAPNPQFVELTLKAELYLNHDKYDEEVTEAERVQYNFWTVTESVCDQLHHMIQFNEAKHWPDGAVGRCCYHPADSRRGAEAMAPARVWGVPRYLPGGRQGRGRAGEATKRLNCPVGDALPPGLAAWGASRFYAALGGRHLQRCQSV